jgi:Flp pilus assembly protein TadG
VLSTKSWTLQQGLATVEFAIVLPLVLLIALAVTELGRGLYQYNTLSKSVQDGVRYLSDQAIDDSGALDITITDPVNGQSLEDNAKNLVIYGDINGGTPLLPGSLPVVTVTETNVSLPSGGISPNHVKVSATYTFSPLFPALSNLGYQMVPSFTASAVQRALML